MQTVQRAVFNKAFTYEKQIAKEKWNKFKELIKDTGLLIKSFKENEILLNIEGEEYADIEIYFKPTIDGYFVHIQLWYYDFKLRKVNEEHNRKNHNFKSIYDAFNYINRILKDIKYDRKIVPSA